MVISIAMLNYQRVGGTFLKWPDWIFIHFRWNMKFSSASWWQQSWPPTLAQPTPWRDMRYHPNIYCPKMGALKSHGLSSWLYWSRTHVNMVEKINKPWLYLKQPRQDVHVAVWNAHCKRKANSAKVSFCIFLLSHHFRLQKSPVVLPIGYMVLVYIC